MTIDIQNNHYFLRCMVIGDFTMTLIYLREMKDNSMKLVISQVSEIILVSITRQIYLLQCSTVS